ncbi:MAG TPA: hypothetical protein EYP48_01760 [Ignisphaera sp.]|uniref:Uncharacterized protein n=1 Tax=Ignisphaera aggregans TaxID=334771 RepID=A0A833DUX8_9CREN|nr:hypothetical protein [Ignisphaera sp.]HIP57634.1 hypothetical protein [Ignisphaera aggregans]
MKFYEGCAIVKIESWVPTRFRDYVTKLFNIARNYPTYIALSSYTITTRIAGMLRRLAIAPGSAILCDYDAYIQFENYIELSEPVWIDAALLIPFATSKPCTKLSSFGIDIRIDPEVGVPTHCLEKLDVDGLSTAINDVLQGGLIDIEKCDIEVRDRIFVAVKYNIFFLLWKVVGIGTPSTYAKILKLPSELPPRVRVFLEPLARIGDNDVVLSIGRGYLSLFSPGDVNSETLYLITLLLAYLLPPNSPRASLYITKILGR